ncbi:MAG: Uma2 family endonuclease [Ardenticatenaceae bacterium]|nr:Uma2 family endonuclease [Ardenticatenaceae bacterium]
MNLSIVRRLFTVDEYHQMIAAGIFKEDDRLELIGGELITMSPIGPRHAAVVARMTRLLSQHFSDAALVWVQNPVGLEAYSEPEPDVALIQFRSDFYAQAHPEPEDILLLVEVSDTTLAYDRSVKLPLYAQAGVVEVWLVDVGNKAIEVYRQPAENGYQVQLSLRRGDMISLLLFPEIKLAVADIVGA